MIFAQHNQHAPQKLYETKFYCLVVARVVSESNIYIFSFFFQSVGGLQIVDCLSSRTYELDNLSQVFVYSSELSPFLHQH